MKYKLTKEELEKLLKLYSVTKVARAEGVSYGTIKNWADHHGIEIPKGGK